MTKGQPYHPQSQEKIERQNRKLKKKLRFEISRKGSRGYNWVTGLGDVCARINKQPKEVLGYQTPFAVYFARGQCATGDSIRQSPERL